MDNFITRIRDNKRKEKIRSLWRKENTEKRNFKNIRGLFDQLMKNKELNSYIDDQTFEDLNMEDVFCKLDRNYTTVGQHALYKMLRTPLKDEKKLKLRDKYIQFLQDNPLEREKIQLQLYKIGKNKNDVFDLIWDKSNSNKGIRKLFYILPIINVLAIMSIFVLGLQRVLMWLIMLIAVDFMLHYKVQNILDSYIGCIRYLGSLIKGANNIGKLHIDELDEYITVLKKSSSGCKDIIRKAALIGKADSTDIMAVLMEYVSILFFVQERAYFSVLDKINTYERKEQLKEIYYTLGELDALISVASYRESLDSYCKPELEHREMYIRADGLAHPLVENAVANDVCMSNKGIILTGSNMSGKSTFLRTVGVNAILAQSIYTCTAKEYKSSYFNIMSSISPQDNLMSGKSYYFGEVEAMLRIIKGCNDKVPTLALIDEIFRGTNPVERVSAALEILKYLHNNNSLVVVATHDLELTKLLDDIYDCYYFREEIENNEFKFDYLIKKGVSPTRNAIRILKYLGYPDEIVDNAEKRIAEQ